MTPERLAEIRATERRCRHTNPLSGCSGCAVRDLLEALDEARAERDKYKRTAEVNATCLAGAMRGMDLYSPPPAPLRWSKEPPTSPALYALIKYRGDVLLGEVASDNDVLWWYGEDWCEEVHTLMRAEWCVLPPIAPREPR